MGKGRSGGTPWRVEYLVIPVLVFYALTLFWPALRMVLISMPEGDPFRYYRDILMSGLYQEAMLRTFLYSVVSTLGTLVLGYPLAYFMVRGRTWIRLSITVLVVVPMFVALLVRTFGWMMIFSRTGPINRVLLSLDVIEEPIRLMYTTFAVQVGMVAVLLPFMVLPFYATMRRIEPGLLQAARGLGAPPPAMSTLLLLVTLVVLAVCTRLVSVNDLWVTEIRQQAWRLRQGGQDGKGWRERFRDGAFHEFVLMRSPTPTI